MEKSIKFTTFLTCLFIPVFLVCGKEIGILVFNSHDCGKFLTASAFLMLFMSLSTTTTSMLNSMGLENKTLIYYVIGSIFMLGAVWFLPAIMGVYALLIGFTFLYGITSILNLILLNKNCVQKPKYVKFIIYSALLCLPTTLFGLMLEKLLLSSLGVFLTFIACTIIMIIFNGLLYIGFNLVSFNFLKTKIKGVVKTPKKAKA